MKYLIFVIISFALNCGLTAFAGSDKPIVIVLMDGPIDYFHPMYHRLVAWDILTREQVHRPLFSWRLKQTRPLSTGNMVTVSRSGTWRLGKFVKFVETCTQAIVFL